MVKDWLRREGLRIVVFDGWPYWSPVAVAVFGVIEGFPVFYILIGTTFAAAMAVHLAVKVTTWREIKRVDYKLAFGNVRVRPITDASDRVVAFRLGSEYLNRAIFPITVRVNRLFTVIHDMSGKKLLAAHDPGENRDLVVEPNARCFFDDLAIDVGLQTGQTSYVAEVHCSLEYGKRASDQTVESKVVKRFGINVDHAGRYLGHTVGYDA
ncbi:MAG: hypothetical protein OXI46_03905 [Gemmatimonadota bacterium]|nr:hypothetical protein [Gemmatimonadota bacterium]